MKIGLLAGILLCIGCEPENRNGRFSSVGKTYTIYDYTNQVKEIQKPVDMSGWFDMRLEEMRNDRYFQTQRDNTTRRRNK